MPAWERPQHLAGDVKRLQDRSSTQPQQEGAHERLCEALHLAVIFLQTWLLRISHHHSAGSSTTTLDILNIKHMVQDCGLSSKQAMRALRLG